MSYINPVDYPVNFSSKISDAAFGCPDLVSEKSINIYTENGLIIKQDCIPDRYVCSGTCAREESTSSFTITNTCALPITITGFVLDDPDNFSILKSSYYTDVYSTEFVDELPITIQPYSAVDIPTFFKPSITELENVDGQRPTFENRVGEKLTSRLNIYPGFPVFNFDDSNYCNTYVTLSGEFMCDDKERYDYSWTGNTLNFENVTLASLGAFNLRKYTNTFNLKRTRVFTSTSSDNLMGAICEYILYLNDNNWFTNLSSNWAIIASLRCVESYLRVYSSATTPANIQGKFLTPYWISPVNPISSSSFGPESIISNFVLDGENYIGVRINTESSNLPKGYIRDQILFFTNPNGQDRIKIFLCDDGDVFNTEIALKDWKDGYTPSTPDGATYDTSPRMSLSNNKIIENSKLGTTIGIITTNLYK